MFLKKNLSKKNHRINIQQKNLRILRENELINKIICKSKRNILKIINNSKIRSICKINGIYGQTNKNTNLNRHFIRLNLNKTLLRGWFNVKW